MPLLHVALHDGFEDEPVVIRVDGTERYRKEKVKTRTQISLADSFELDAEPGTIEVSIELPGRGDTHRVVLDVTAATYLGLSVFGHDLQERVSNQPFGYV